MSEKAQKQALSTFDEAIGTKFSNAKKILKLSDEEIKNVKTFKDLSEEQQEEFVKNFAESFKEKKLNNEEATNEDILDSILGDNEVADENTQEDQDEVSSGDDDSKTEKTDSNGETSDKDKKGPEVEQSIDKVFDKIANDKSLNDILNEFYRFGSSKDKQLFLKVKVGSKKYIYINLKAFSTLCNVLNVLYKEEAKGKNDLIPELNLSKIKSSFDKCNAVIDNKGLEFYSSAGAKKKNFSQIGSSDFFSLEDSNTDCLLEYNYLLKMMVGSPNLGFCKECLEANKTLTTTCVKKAKEDSSGKRNGWFDDNNEFNFTVVKDDHNMTKLIENFLK